MRFGKRGDGELLMCSPKSFGRWKEVRACFICLEAQFCFVYKMDRFVSVIAIMGVWLCYLLSGDC